MKIAVRIKAGQIWKHKQLNSCIEVVDTVGKEVKYKFVGSESGLIVLESKAELRDSFEYVRNKGDVTRGRKFAVPNSPVATLDFDDKGVITGMHIATDAPKTDSREFNHYYINVSGYDYIDIYRVTDLYGCTSAEHHAIKKIACGGKRGAKGKIKDLREAIASLERQIEMLEEDSGER